MESLSERKRQAVAFGVGLVRANQTRAECSPEHSEDADGGDWRVATFLNQGGIADLRLTATAEVAGSKPHYRTIAIGP